MKTILVRNVTGIAILSVVLLAFSVAGAAMAAEGSLGNPRVAPPNAKPYGKTYGEWQAAWWQWAMAIPFNAHPLTDSAPAETGQAGHVWFLGGSFVSATASREVNIPAGTALFFPIANTECSTEEAPPFYGANLQELTACADAFVDTVVDLACELDGVPVENPYEYRSVSPMFDFWAPDPNVLWVNGTGPITGSSVSDGYYLFLNPLSVGTHTLHFTGRFPDWNLTMDISYTINVLPK